MSTVVIADLEALLPHAQRSNSKALLNGEIKRQRELLAAPTASALSAPPKPAPLKKEVVATVVPFGKISKYAWDQSKKFVKLYITLPGIEKVPDSSVSLEVQATSLKFEVRDLAPPSSNMRLAVLTLHSAVDPAQCSWARKADSMVLVKLRKVKDEEEWGSLDDAAIQQAKKKAEKLETNKGKSTAELLSEMYADADEDGKASLAAAWETGRSKREGKAEGNATVV